MYTPHVDPLGLRRIIVDAKLDKHYCRRPPFPTPEKNLTTIRGRVNEQSLCDDMAETVVLSAVWFTARMICQVSYKAIKSYLKGKQLTPETKEALTFNSVHDYAVTRSTKDELNDEGCVPWRPVVGDEAVSSTQHHGSLLDDDNWWIEELRRASMSKNRDSALLMREIQPLGDRVDDTALHDYLRHALQLLLEYQANPDYRKSHLLQKAEEAAQRVYHNERSLVMSLSALRFRIVATYLHDPGRSMGLDPSMDDKGADKRQCQLYIMHALRQGPVEALCRRFLADGDSRDNEQLRDRVDVETMMAFDIILEIISSVYILEPFNLSQGPLPKDVPHIVLSALWKYCKNMLGASVMYTEVAQALNDWESSPQTQEKWALHCLYESTEGPKWSYSGGWDRLFEANLSSLYGVSTEAGRVTKIYLGANNLEGRIPPQIGNLAHLQELSLPGNKLFGKIPPALWDLPRLRVVALDGNSFTVTPPELFKPAEASAGGGFHEPARRTRGVAGKVETLNPGRLEVYEGEWFVCLWKITNSGSVAFARGSKLSRGQDSFFGGAEDVPVNPLAPGEKQTVAVMQQAPNFETWARRDEWFLVGECLDFVDDDDARAQTPDITVAPRPAGGGKKGAGDASSPTLADTVFVAGGRFSRGTYSHRTESTRYSSSSSHQFSRHFGKGLHAVTKDAAPSRESLSAGGEGDEGRLKAQSMVSPSRQDAAKEFHEAVPKASPAEAEMTFTSGLSNKLLLQEESTLAARDTVLTKSLGPGPVIYESRAHAVELELQAGSLDEELPLEVTITQRLAFVDCCTAESGSASTEEFLVMTFVDGPEGVTFPVDKPAKLRFFLGYVDSLASAGKYDSDPVVISDEEIERDILHAYRPLSSPDGVENWTSLGKYLVLFRRVNGQREVWVETPVKHFSVTANAMKVNKGESNQSYFYGDLGGLRWWFKGRSSAPKIRLGNTTKNHCATFTYYPIVEHTEASYESERHAEIGAVEVTLGGGNRNHYSAVGSALPAAGEKITMLVENGTYADCDLSYDVKEHSQMHVRVGILVDMTGEGLDGHGKLRLLDVRKISGNKILVLRERRLKLPTKYGKIDWPCDDEDICRLR